MNPSTFVIGDIHGGLRALEQVLERAPIKSSDLIIFLGDYVDGWSKSFQVINFLIEFQEKQNCLFLKGNHDACCEEWLKTGNLSPASREHGGIATIQSYEGISELDKNKHIHFLESLKYYHIDELNRLFVHAGFTSPHGPSKEFNQSYLIWERTLWEMALSMDTSIPETSARYPKRLSLFKEIYIGHSPTINYGYSTPMNIQNIWNLDTGAGFSGKLTILEINSKQYWQSDQVASLYPNEIGRKN